MSANSQIPFAFRLQLAERLYFAQVMLRSFIRDLDKAGLVFKDECPDEQLAGIILDLIGVPTEFQDDYHSCLNEAAENKEADFDGKILQGYSIYRKLVDDAQQLLSEGHPDPLK